MMIDQIRRRAAILRRFMVDVKHLDRFDLRPCYALYYVSGETMEMAQPLARESILEVPEMPPGAAGNVSSAIRLLRSSLPEAFRSRLRSARELEREIRDAASEGAFPTAVPALDRLLDGGLPRGQLVELVGGRSSGRFSTPLAVLAAAPSVGEAVALVDLGDGLDPQAGLAPGADLARPLWRRPTTLKDGLAAAPMLLAR